MKNFLAFLIIVLFIGFAIITGIAQLKRPFPPHRQLSTPKNVPYIGKVQVLNGCGTEGVAHLMADHLRKHHFDVKDIGNADNWNFPETMVISRVNDTTVASQIAGVLHTGNMVLIKKEEALYDVTVIVGPDYRERIR
jgi:hypothetical protein